MGCTQCKRSGAPATVGTSANGTILSGPAGSKPTAKNAGVPVKVKVFEARGLTAGRGSKGPVCSVEVVGRPRGALRTGCGTKAVCPEWNHELSLPGVRPGDQLRFTVWDGWYKLGTAVLDAAQVRAGFIGDVPLVGGGQDALLKVNVDGADANAAEELTHIAGEVQESVEEAVADATDIVQRATSGLQQVADKFRSDVEGAAADVRKVGDKLRADLGSLVADASSLGDMVDGQRGVVEEKTVTCKC